MRVGQYCSSCYEGDWHRSLIVNIVDSDTVKVTRIYSPLAPPSLIEYFRFVCNRTTFIARTRDPSR